MKLSLYVSSALMLISSAAAQTPEPPCLQACKDQCYIDKDCPSFKKPQNCYNRCDSNCVDKIAKKGCGGTDAPTPEPTKAPLPAVPACLGSCVDDCKSGKGCDASDVKCDRRCTDSCLAKFNKKGCPGAPTGSPTFAPLKPVPACLGPCVSDCEIKKGCATAKKPAACTKRCTKKCLKKYKKKGCPKTPKPTSSPTPAPFTSPPVQGTFACNTLVKSGGQQTQDYKIIFTGTVYTGNISIYYQMYTIPDKISVLYEGKTVFTTGGLVSGSQTVTRFIDGKTDFAIVRMVAVNPGTGWNFNVGCVA